VAAAVTCLTLTEHGAFQAASVLNSPGAVELGIYLVRAFVQLRELLISNKGSSPAPRTPDQLEARIEKKLGNHDDAIAAMPSAIRQLMNPPARKRRSIGFRREAVEAPRCTGPALHRSHRQQTLHLIQRAAGRLSCIQQSPGCQQPDSRRSHSLLRSEAPAPRGYLYQLASFCWR